MTNQYSSKQDSIPWHSGIINPKSWY